MEKTHFSKTLNEKEVSLFSLRNNSGVKVNVINYGAIVTNIFMPDKEGKLQDIVLGYDNLDGYIKDNWFMGAIVGRFGNRISKGRFSLNGKTYQLNLNNGRNHLHGGLIGFSKVVWNIEDYNQQDRTITLKYESPDGEENYPGNLSLTVIYKLTEENELIINYKAETDKTTILNPTHHSYFNLTGNFSKPIVDHEIFLDADKFLEVDDEGIPTGCFINVENSSMDFRNVKRIGHDIGNAGFGYDHNWIINNYNSKVKKAASAYDPDSGRFLEVFTDQPGMQFYTGNYLNGATMGKDGIAHNYRTGFCFEAQHFPDSPNHPEFPSVVLNPGEIYKQETIYKFSVK